MLTKEQIDQLKTDNLSTLYQILQNGSSDKEILYILKNLGKLPDDFEGDLFVPFLQSPSDEIRLWAVKSLGKVKDLRYFDALSQLALHDDDSMVRREAVSSIGRMRSRETIPVLLELVDEHDPKIVLQAIRALLNFKYNPRIQDKLKTLATHPNEQIQAVISKEFGLNERSDSSQYPHPHSPVFMRNVVVHGDVRNVLCDVPDVSIHLTFTSPPYYNARDYSIYISYEQYLDFLTAVFIEVHRVTKEGRFFILNTSPVIVPRISRAHSSKRYPIPFDIHPRLIDIGWEFIDDIVWAKPEASVKNRNAGFLQHRKPLAYKPNAVTEYLMVYRKKTDKLLDWNMRQYDRKTVENSKVLGEYETSNLWQIDPTFDRVHSAVFPSELCQRVITYYSYAGDLIFDPFGGSGTLGKVAQSLDRYFFLTEQDDSYFDYIQQNIGGQTLFNQYAPQYLTLPEFQKLASEFRESQKEE